MPNARETYSWLSSPRRKKTTSNLTTKSAGKVPSAPPSRSSTTSRTTVSRTTEQGSPRARISVLNNSPPARPTTAARALSVPAVGSPVPGGQANLFSAYAQRDDGSGCRYLLTFASISIAGEWSLLLHKFFPNSTRVGPRLFTYKDDDLMPKVWRHVAFEHLKAKWMYMSLSDSASQELGGATQVVPQDDAVDEQDSNDNCPSSPTFSPCSHMPNQGKSQSGQVENFFEKLIAEQSKHPREAVSITDSGYFGADATRDSNFREGGPPLQPQLWPSPNKISLSLYLEKIQHLMERTTSGRDPPVGFDSDLIRTKLTDIETVMERSAVLLQALINGEEGRVKRDRTSSSALDLSPLSEHLSSIHSAIEQHTVRLESKLDSQNNHDAVREAMHHLSTNNDKLSEKLRNAVDAPKTSSMYSIESVDIALEETNQHLRILREWTEYDSEHIREILDLQKEESTKRQNLAILLPSQKQVQQRLDRMDAQMRKLISGQQEMVDVVRQLAESITVSTKGQCDHVVVPPPRKMGRKIVGFVYDGKEV